MQLAFIKEACNKCACTCSRVLGSEVKNRVYNINFTWWILSTILIHNLTWKTKFSSTLHERSLGNHSSRATNNESFPQSSINLQATTDNHTFVTNEESKQQSIFPLPSSPVKTLEHDGTINGVIQYLPLEATMYCQRHNLKGKLPRQTLNF